MVEKTFDFECPTCGNVFSITTEEEDKPVHCPFCAADLDGEEDNDGYGYWDDEEE